MIEPIKTTVDRRGRAIRDLRISVTDRCNFRCVYCMPKELFGSGHAFLDRKQLLSFEEIERVARAFVANGVKKLRITGGEPLVRREIEKLVTQLAAIDEVEDLSLTTNGSLLTADRARALREAGLKRVTISLDALDNDIFRAINDVKFPVSRVLDAVDNARTAGLDPVKVNMVVVRGSNDGEILPMAEHFRANGVILRFIEYMDVGTSNGWNIEQVVSVAEIFDIVNKEFPIVPVAPGYRGEVAKRCRYIDGAGEIGIISSVTQPFCGTCTRARISAEGQVYTCLFASQGHDLRELVRSDIDDRELAQAIAQIWRRRDDRYSEIRSDETRELPKIEMSYIGG